MPADEVLYESATTRVARRAAASAGGTVICKVCPGADGAKRLRNEKDLLARLSGIDGISRLEGQDPGPGLLMLHDCGGVTLAQVLQKGRCDTAAVLSLAASLARTLAEVHRTGVIHRDINPTNIVVAPSGDVVLIDFDLAVLAEEHLTVAPDGKIVGTLGYLAPEQTGRTGRALDQRGDLYALGATLYEMATGRPPFEGTDTLQLIHDHLVREPVPPSQLDAGVPPGLSAIILRLLAKAPEQRYQSAEGLLHDVQRLRSELQESRSGIFELGERDFATRLAAPAGLVGREAELALLQAALADAMDSPRHTVLIEGPAGVGKSALIQQFRSAMPLATGWFVQGKFDQYQKGGATAGALTQALRALGRLLLAQSGAQLAAQRQRILQVLGATAGLATRLPEFALLLGEQQEVPQVDPQQAELQLQQMAVDLVRAVATPEWPLVIVLDDLQWAAASALRAFERLMNAPDIRGFLLIGAMRPDDMDAGQVLAPALAQWRAGPRPPVQIPLVNLTLAGMSELTGRMLRLATGPSRELAEAVRTLTGGNPFDTVEMINALRHDGVLSLRESGWQWDEVKIRRFIGRGNVVDLLAARIARLPARSRALLEFMSCIGNAVELKLLSAAVGLTADELQAQLRPPLEDGLLVADAANGQPSGLEVVRFRHDRVQQALLGAMDDARRGQRQLEMARRLAGEPGLKGEAARHYLACLGQLEDAEEQRLAARLFHGLAQALAASATFLLAERYLAAASALLAGLDDPRDAALRRAIDLERHCALYGLGRVDEADPLFANIQERTQEPLDLVEPTCLQMKSLDMRGRMADGMVLGQRMLAQLGLHVPADYRDEYREQRLDALADWVRQESRLDPLALPQPQDPHLLAIYKLLARMVGSALHAGDMDAYTWLLLESQRLWAEHGPSPDLVATLGNMGQMIIGQRQDYRTAYDITHHLITVGEALGFEVRTATTRFLFAGRTCRWFEPLESALAHSRRAYEVVATRGDPSFACYVHIHTYDVMLDTGPTIAAWEAEIEAGLVLCRRTGNIHAAVLHMCELQFARALSGKTSAPDSFDDGQFNEKAFMAKVGHLSFVQFADARALLALIGGDAAALARHAPLAMPSGQGVGDSQRTFHQYLCLCLAHAWQLQLGDPLSPDAAPLIAELQACRSWLATRAADQPYNYLHQLLLVEAEEAWALGDWWKAAATFDLAVTEAETRQRPWQRALIAERAGRFHLARGMAGTGRGLLARARDHYEAWGATVKVDQMQREHPFLQTPDRSLGSPLRGSIGHSVKSSSNVSPDALDLMGVLRASQALSSERSLEQLAARVTAVLASLSGATKVLVVWSSEGHWWLLSPAPGRPAIPLAQAAEHGMLPLSAVTYVQRTGEALIVDDVADDGRFARDPYFAGVPVCSLLLAPIAGQGADKAVLLLENRLGRAAFNAQRLDAVMLIAGQLAVSLANAQLYESLEQRVQARTHELQETQAQLVAAARRAGKAEIANNVLHNVGNVLNSINVSASVLRSTIGNSRVEGLTRAVALINEHEHDLGHFIDTDPRGKALRSYLNELVGALQSERLEALGNLERLSHSVDHITYIVTTQQSHAGPSSVMEVSRLEVVIEEALHLAAESIEGGGIVVVRRYGDVPAMTLDKQRLAQILVNLIGNAAQAMEGMPAADRLLTLATGLIRVDGKACVRITVQDCGEGITQENLARIFAHGFTTRTNGHGFGLHSSALAATEMGGKVSAQSDGPGLGATFTIDLPIADPAPVNG